MISVDPGWGCFFAVAFALVAACFRYGAHADLSPDDRHDAILARHNAKNRTKS